METYAKLLQTYSGRDKIMRTSGYVAMMLSGTVKGNSQQRLVAFARQISNGRVILRLFDDVPMWYLTRTWSADEKDLLSRLCSVISNVSSQVFLPIEHIAWSSDNGVLPVESSKNWWTAGTVCWIISLVCNIVRGIRRILLLKESRQQLVKQRILESPDRSGEAEVDYRSAMKKFADQEIDEYWTLLKNSADLVVAINGLPWKQFLWAGKLASPRSAFFGAISSLVGLYLMIKAQRPSSGKKSS